MPAQQPQTNTEAVLSDAEFRRISDLVYRHCGINLHDGKKDLVRARLAKQMRLKGFDSATAYVNHVLADPSGQSFKNLIDSVSTNLTSFFREGDHFRYLVEHFLPALVRRKQAERSSQVLVWSAGCSTGEEPYSLAMTLLEELGPQGKWDVRILATDISTRVLEQARAGVFAADRVDTIPPPLRQKYFAPVKPGKDGTGGGFQVNPAVRGLIQFRYLNLMEAWPFRGPFDFIFCRNVMIYFDKPTQEKLINRYFDLLEPAGLLFTGHSESLTGVKHAFRYVQPTIYAKPANSTGVRKGMAA